MYIKSIKLNNFRNIDNIFLEFNKEANVIFGNNAQGKTNIIEAIYLFSHGRGFRTNKDKELLKFDENYFFTQIKYVKNNEENEIIISYDKTTNKKYIKINNIVQKKLSSIIGNINLVIFKPNDIELIKNGPSIRRKFLDILISSLEKKYLYFLSKYNNILEERNKILKLIKLNDKNSEKYNSNIELLNIYTEQLIENCVKIYNYRHEYIEKLNKEIYTIHENISNNKINVEKLKLKYISKCSNYEELKREYDRTLDMDIQKGFTEIGIHKDDFKITINSLDVEKYGSQGQQKSSVLSLKLAELKIIENKVGEKPILLLDDFMSELDDNRIKNIINSIKDIQIILTTTKKVDILNKVNEHFYIENGIITNYTEE